MGKHSKKIVIVGGGPAGLVAALLASQHGLEVTLIERYSPERYHGFAHYLNAQSLDILMRAGVDMQPFKERKLTPEREMSMAFGTNVRDIFARIALLDDQDFSKKHFYLGPMSSGINLGLHVWKKYLLEAVAQSPRITVLWQHEVLSLDQEARLLSVKDLCGNNTQTIKYRFLLAADGSKSAIAAFLQVPHRKPAKEWQTFLNVETHADLRGYIQDPAMMIWLYQPQASACLVVHDIQELQVWQIPVMPSIEGMAMDEAKIRALLYDFLGIENSLEGNDLKLNIASFGYWTMRTHALEALSACNESVFFIGDSAHCMTPAGGLGLNTALADADNVIWKIAREIQSKGAGDLQSYHTERFAHGLERMQYSIDHYRNFLKVPEAFGLSEKLSPISAGLRTIGWGITEALKIGALPHDYVERWEFGKHQATSSALKGLERWIALRVEQRRFFDRVLPSLEAALESNKQYFIAFYSHLAYFYPKEGLWSLTSNPRQDPMPDDLKGGHRHSRNEPRDFTVGTGVWAGYLKCITEHGGSEFITEHAQDSYFCVVSVSKEAYDCLSAYVSESGYGEKITRLQMSPYSFNASQWEALTDGYIILRPDRIVHAVWPLDRYHQVKIFS